MNILAKIENFFEKLFGGLLSKKDLSFLGWFFVVILVTVGFLSVFGLLPSELQEESAGNNFIESGSEQIDTLLGLNQNNSSKYADNGYLDGSVYGNSNNILDVLNNNSSGNSGNSGNGKNPSTVAPSNSIIGSLPTKLRIPSINVDTVIYNPISTSTSKLDYELTKGPVRYPGSGSIGSGNMFIFGHSTGFKIVQNRAYKVFNDLKKLKEGDLIYVDSEYGTATYSVREVTEVNKDKTLITFDTTVNMLTLSTCDSFGKATDRFVVTADFVGVQ